MEHPNTFHSFITDKNIVIIELDKDWLNINSTLSVIQYSCIPPPSFQVSYHSILNYIIFSHNAQFKNQKWALHTCSDFQMKEWQGTLM